MYYVANMYEVIEYLCKRSKISIAQMCREINMRQSIITDLKYGRTKSLSHANMIKIANYFQVSTDVFMEGTLGEGFLEVEETLPNAADSKSIVGFHYILDQKERQKKELSPISDEALKIAIDYDMLSPAGQQMVRLVVDQEKRRMQND